MPAKTEAEASERFDVEGDGTLGGRHFWRTRQRDLAEVVRRQVVRDLLERFRQNLDRHPEATEKPMGR